jgi:signal transduction histidine kinase
VTDKKRPSDKVEDHAQEESRSSAASPRPPKRPQHQRQFSLPFSSDSGTVAVTDREQLHALLSSSPIIVFVLDRQARFTMFEGKGAALLPSTQQSWVGRTLVDLFPDDGNTRRRFVEALDGTIVNWTERLGDQMVQTTLTPVRDRQDMVTGLLGIGIVSSDNGPVAGPAASAPESVPEGSPLKNKFFAQVSHELRTPLNSIVGFSHLLLKNGESRFGEQDLFYIQRIAGNASHLLGVVADMMDLTVIETGKARIVVSEVDLADLIRETISEIGSGARHESPVLRAEIPQNVRPIEADRQKLKQVLINLLANALKFTQRGSVTISVGVDEFLRPVRIDVRDTGMGIPADKLEVVFEAFERGEQASGQEVEGTGLGLTISRALCRLMGYTLHVSSEPGKGSTFTIDMLHTTTAIPGEPS